VEKTSLRKSTPRTLKEIDQQYLPGYRKWGCVDKWQLTTWDPEVVPPGETRLAYIS